MEVETTGLPFADFGRQASELEQEEFVKLHPYPVLVADVPFPKSSGSYQTVAARPLPKEGNRLVYPLIKSKRNVFAGMITAGRANNNDIILSDPSVSKFHAYFGVHPKTQQIWVQDAGSTFGTWLHTGVRVEQTAPTPLKSGDGITLGQQSQLTLFLAADFHGAAQLMQLKGFT